MGSNPTSPGAQSAPPGVLDAEFFPEQGDLGGGLVELGLNAVSLALAGGNSAPCEGQGGGRKGNGVEKARSNAAGPSSRQRERMPFASGSHPGLPKMVGFQGIVTSSLVGSSGRR